MSHIRESHKDYIELMKLQKDNSQGSIYQYVDSKTKNIWGWMKFIVKRGVPVNLEMQIFLKLHSDLWSQDLNLYQK